MKHRNLILFFLPLFLAVATVANAGLTKEEKKKLKEAQKKEKQELKLLKKMDPRQIRAMKLGLEKQSADISQCSAQRDSLQNAVYALLLQNAEQDSLIQEMESQMMAKGKVGGAGSGTKIIPSRGIVFTVQLGAYKDYNIAKKMGSGGMQMESDEGMHKYLLGTFKSLDKAEAFRKEIARMGIKDAWVVAFKNGKRIPKEDAAAMLGGNLTSE